MGTHLRQQIREAIAIAITGLPTTGGNVFQSRVYPAQTNELPCLLVRSTGEQSLPLSMGSPRTFQRTLTVVVDAIVESVSDLDDVLDGICMEVEVALSMPVLALSGIATEITLTGTEIEMEGNADRPLGRASMTFEVVYFAAENAPDVAL